MKMLLLFQLPANTLTLPLMPAAIMISANVNTVKENAENANAVTKCDGRMNAANVNRPDETTNAKNENARNANAANMNAASMNDRNAHAGNRENATARNYGTSNANAMNTNTENAKDTVTSRIASNLNAGKKKDATRKH